MSPQKPASPKTPASQDPSLMYYVDLTIELKRQYNHKFPERKKLLQRFYLAIPQVNPKEAELLMARLAEDLATIFRDAQIQEQAKTEQKSNNPQGLILPDSQPSLKPPAPKKSSIILPPGVK